MAEAEAKGEYFYKGTAEEEEAKLKTLALPDEWLGTWTQRKENGVENFDEYLKAGGVGAVKRALVRTIAMNSFQFTLAKNDDEGNAVENGYFFKATKPKSVVATIPLGNVSKKVTLPKGEVDLKCFFVDNKLVVETYFPHKNKITYERITRTIKDGVMTHFVDAIDVDEIEAARAKGETPTYARSHTRYLIKEAVEK